MIEKIVKFDQNKEKSSKKKRLSYIHEFIGSPYQFQIVYEVKVQDKKITALICNIKMQFHILTPLFYFEQVNLPIHLKMNQ